MMGMTASDVVVTDSEMRKRPKSVQPGNWE
jgi:hypothetical protein